MLFELFLSDCFCQLKQGSCLAHPIVDVYNQFRTTRLNIIYLETVVTRLKCCNTLMDCAIALAASSDVAGIWFLQGATSQIVWKWLIGITAILSVIKPLLRLTTRVQKGEKELLGYKLIFFDIQKLIIKVNQGQRYTAALKTDFLKILDRRANLIHIEEAHFTFKRLLRKCYEQVNLEIPCKTLLIPKEDANEYSSTKT